MRDDRPEQFEQPSVSVNELHLQALHRSVSVFNLLECRCKGSDLLKIKVPSKKSPPERVTLRF